MEISKEKRRILSPRTAGVLERPPRQNLRDRDSGKGRLAKKEIEVKRGEASGLHLSRIFVLAASCRKQGAF